MGHLRPPVAVLLRAILLRMPDVPPISTRHLATRTADVGPLVERELARTQGLLRLAPCWVPRAFVQPGRRLKLHPDDLYAFGLDRGGIDERWFASTIEAANAGRVPRRGPLLHRRRTRARDAARRRCGVRREPSSAKPSGRATSAGPCLRSSSTTAAPIPHHMHQDAAQAALVGREAKPEGYYFPPQMNARGNDFPFTFFGLAPGTTKADVRRCLERWHTGDNGILDLAQASRLEVGTGWLIPPRMLHAPGSLCTYEPQWASDVLAMYQSVVDGQRDPVGPAGAGRAARAPPRSRLPGRSAGLGCQPRSRLQGDAPAPPARGRRRASASSIDGSSTGASTAPTCSPRRNSRSNPAPPARSATTARGDSCASRARARSTASRSPARR